VLTSACTCLQPELCEHALEVSQKFDATRTDPRGRSAALESYRAFRDANKSTEYSQMVDVYAFAVMMFEMTCHQPPWDTGIGEKEIRENVSNGERPSLSDVCEKGAPTGWVQLMWNCWDQDAGRRSSFAEALPALVRMRDAVSAPEESRVSFHEASGAQVAEVELGEQAALPSMGREGAAVVNV
jgi:serine/threonine protein kinase